MTETMCLIISCGVLVVAINVLWMLDRRAWRIERQDLLNRLMSRDFGQYVSGHNAIAEARYKTKPTPEQIFEYLENQEDEVLPVG